MNKKSIIFAAVFAMIFSFAAITTINAADKGPADMVLETAKKKKPAEFPHKKHQDLMPCSECHHGKDDAGKQTAYKEGMKIQKCASCHDKDMANAKLNNFMKAAHANCKDCHKKGYKGKKGPTKCSGCHPKKK